MSIRLSEFELDVMTHFWATGSCRRRSCTSASAASAASPIPRSRRSSTGSSRKARSSASRPKGARSSTHRSSSASASASRSSKRSCAGCSATTCGRLFAQLLQDEKLSGEELEYLRKLVAEAERTKK